MERIQTQLFKSTLIRLSIQMVLTIIIAMLLLFYLTNSIQSDVIESQQSFLGWMTGLLRGNFGHTINYNQEIVFFSANNSASQKAIGPALFQTISLAASGLFTGFILAIILNYFSLFRGVIGRVSGGVKSLLEWLSSLHVIIVALIIYMFWKHETPTAVLVLTLALGSNVFYDFSSEQEFELKKLLHKDFVIAAKAWGDSLWKHIRRSLTLMSITQLFSMWIVVLANTLIVEIIFQRTGLGSEIYQNVLATSRGNFIVETPILLAIIALIIIVVQISNLLKELLILYLADIRR